MARIRIISALLLAPMAATAFTSRTTFRPTSKATMPHNRHARRRSALVAKEEVDYVEPEKTLGEDAFAGNLPDNTLAPAAFANSLVEMDIPVQPLPVVEDVGKDIVLEAISDASATDFISDDGVVKELPMTNDDDSIDAESVSAILAASEQAAAAAEATLLKEPAFMANDTVSVPVVVKEKPIILPASEVVGVPYTAVPTEIDTPDVKKILKFAIPAIGVWLCGPLLSLIDTSAVGLFSGTSQQAALNPAVAVTDYAALLIAFMYTATTNLVAAAQETDRGVEGKPKTTKNLIASLQLSGFVGASLGTLLFVFARPLLRAIIGNDGISPEVFGAAMKYVRIRALGMPAAVVIGSAQAACLGMQDIKSPLYVLLAAAVVNFMGDMLFVGHTHPLLGGAAGAAWATVFSQFAALTLFIKWLCYKPKHQESKVVNLTKAIMELTGDSDTQGASRRRKFRADLKKFGQRHTNPVTTRLASLKKKFAKKKTTTTTEAIPKKEESFSTRGFLAGKFRATDFLRLPKKDKMADFTPYVLPVTTTQVGRVSSYIAMSHVVSSSLGTVSMAAQQVIVSLFYCLTPVADSLSLTAQSFVPAIFERKPSHARSVALRKTAVSFAKAGAVFGALLVGAVGTIPLVSRFFTSDAAVSALVNSVVPWLLGFFSLHGILCAIEGVLLGQKDLSFLGKSYAGYFFVIPYIMLQLKKKALAGVGNIGLTSLWKVFFAYNIFRSALWVGRSAQLQLRTERQEAAEEGTI